MSVIETIETLKSGLMWIGLSALAAIAVGVVGAWMYRSACSVVAWVWRLFGSEKTRSGGALGDRALPGVTAEEIAQGWRLESVVTKDAVLYAMPTNGVEYALWSLGGGYERHFPLDLGDDFVFPFGTGVVRRFDVLSGGTVESLPRQRVEGQYSSAMPICAAREWCG